MRPITEKEKQTEEVYQPNSPVSKEEIQAEESQPQHERVIKPSGTRKWTIVAVAIVAMLGLALIAWMLWFRSKREEGKPVSAPRTISFDQSSGISNEPATTAENVSEPTLTISPDQLQRTGIKIEQIGEQLSTTGMAAASTGIVQSNSYRETPVVSLVGGIVRRVNAELGEYVRKGQTLAVVFSEELAMAQSSYIKALAERDEHHNHHKRTIKLVEIGAASRAELEEATTKIRSVEAEIANMQQKLQLLGLSPQRIKELKSSSQISSEVSIAAPASGTVINRAVNPGEVIEEKKELLRVADLSSIWVVGQVYEKELGKVRVGSGASITTDTYPGKIFRGRISYVDPRLDPQTRTAQVRIELANPNQIFKIGMYVNIAFATIGGSESVSPTLPVAAVQNINNQQVIFLATKEPNVFIYRPVRVGTEANGYYPVIEGIQVGDRVVTEGSFLLRAEWLKLHPNTH
jgi:membrane fusion protein, heavy metal efflux system